MANIMNLSVTPRAAAQVNVPRFEIEFQVVDNDGTVLQDFTGQNSLMFPAILTSLSAVERRRVVQAMLHMIIQMQANLVARE